MISLSTIYIIFYKKLYLWSSPETNPNPLHFIYCIRLLPERKLKLFWCPLPSKEWSSGNVMVSPAPASFAFPLPLLPLVSPKEEKWNGRKNAPRALLGSHVESFWWEVGWQQGKFMEQVCEPAEKMLGKSKNVWAKYASQSTYTEERECRAAGG